ncbi:hypothetical protein MCEMSEM23_02546 [Rhabdaerophilaceae bacterium]
MVGLFCFIPGRSTKNRLAPEQFASKILRIGRRLRSIDVKDAFSNLFILRGVPGDIRTDNRPEFIAKAIQKRITAVVPKAA